MPLTEINISGSEFVKNISVIKTTMRGTYRLPVGVFCGEDCLKIRSGPLTSTVVGKGYFEGMAIIPLVLLIEFAETISPEDRIIIKKFPSSIGIGPLQINCEWREVDFVIPDWPYKATLAQIIGLKQRYEPEVLNYQNLSNTIKQAQGRSVQIMKQAALLLVETGITFDDLDMLLDDVTQRSAIEDQENVIW